MPGYVLKRNEDGKYVAPGGSAEAYTRRLERAQVFPTREFAERHKCGNETAYPVDELIGGG